MVENNKLKTDSDNKKTLSKLAFGVHFLASILAIMTILTIYTSYFNPYVVTTEIYREYFPEDYLMDSSLKTPNYSLKTTEIITIKPQSALSLGKNSKVFYLPKESYDIVINPSDYYECESDKYENKITCDFSKKRSSIENIQLSFSYKQHKNPKVILLDYSAIVGANTIEENLILENTENAKITSFRAIWLINNNNSSRIANIKNTPNYILVDGNQIKPDVNKTKVLEFDALIYSWDINFKENEIKSIKIFTDTNVNYTIYDLKLGYIKEEPSFKFEFPFKENNFNWSCPLLYIKDFPYPNTTGYYNGSSMRIFCFPWNSTAYNLWVEKHKEEGTFIG